MVSLDKPFMHSGFFIMAKICGIYKITSPTGKVYIGQSIDIKKRWRDHSNSITKTKLNSSFISHGFINHIFEIIHECERCDLDRWEIHYIGYFDTFNTRHGLNLNIGGGGNKGIIVSDETRKRLSIAGKGKKRTAEFCARLSEINKGKKHSPETLIKLSQAKIGHKRSEETKAKIKKNNARTGLGRVLPEETRRSISEKLKGNKNGRGYVATPETRRKISVANTGKKHSQEAIEKCKVASKAQWDNMTIQQRAERQAKVVAGKLNKNPI